MTKNTSLIFVSGKVAVVTETYQEVQDKIRGIVAPATWIELTERDTGRPRTFRVDNITSYGPVG